jgi:hypothetical protein
MAGMAANLSPSQSNHWALARYWAWSGMGTALRRGYWISCLQQLLQVIIYMPLTKHFRLETHVSSPLFSMCPWQACLRFCITFFDLAHSLWRLDLLRLLDHLSCPLNSSIHPSFTFHLLTFTSPLQVYDVLYRIERVKIILQSKRSRKI